MRKVTAGNGLDSTAACAAWLKAGNKLNLSNLILIGEPEDPQALWLTDNESPLLWSCWGTFYPSVVERSSVTSAIGLVVQSMTLTWSPPRTTYAASVAAASPYQLALLGFFDNRSVRIWTVYLPTPGDANTFGASELFGGRIADTSTKRGSIQFTVNSFLDVVNQDVPTNVIELTNTLAAYTAATPPRGYSRIPQFNVAAGGSTTQVIGDQTSPSAHSILDTNNVLGGYLAFNTGPNSTLGGVWAAIQQNIRVTIDRTDYNQFLLYTPLPWPPTPGVDTFYVSGQAPIDQSDGDYFGFPYVPDPSLAV